MSDDTKQRDAWLAERRTMIGASETPSILGTGYETAADVWARKIGAETKDDESLRLFIGNALQNGILDIARHVMQLPIVNETPWSLRRYPARPYVGASLDAYIDDGGVHVPVDAKNVDKMNAREWEAEPPLDYQVQLQQQMLVTGASYGYLFALVGGNQPVFHRVERNDAFIAAMLKKLAWFWNLVETRTPPPYEDPADQARTLAALYPKGDGTSLALPERAAFYLDRYEKASRVLADVKEYKEACANNLKSLLGDSTYGRLPDGRWVSWKSQTVAEHVVKESTFRVLRTHAKAPKDAPALAPINESLLASLTTALIERGAVLRDRSAWGSRYLELAGGLLVRLSDHESNEKTAAWMKKREVAEIRVDQPDWQDQLTAIAGPIQLTSPASQESAV